jgi:sulfur-oxidizing protein SoxZ
MLIQVPRVQVPATAAKDEIFAVKALITHQMETGLRHDDQGKIIPRKIINRFVCRYRDVVVFSADFHESVAANPFIEFYLRATDSGALEFIWEEDGGGVSRLEHHLTVS